MFMKISKIFALCLMVTICCAATPVFASTGSLSIISDITGTGGLPWESPLQKIVESLTGYWAYAVVVIAFVAAAAMLFFGQAEMQSWVRTLLFLIMCASMLMGGGKFAKNVLGMSGMLLL